MEIHFHKGQNIKGAEILGVGQPMRNRQGWEYDVMVVYCCSQCGRVTSRSQRSMRQSIEQGHGLLCRSCSHKWRARKLAKPKIQQSFGFTNTSTVIGEINCRAGGNR